LLLLLGGELRKTYKCLIYLKYIKMIDFEQQKREHSLRQRYLEEVDFGEFAPFIKGIIYVPQFKDNTLMEFLPKNKSILVFENAYLGNYEASRTEGNFLSTLIDHEGKHAEQFSNRSQLKKRSLEEGLNAIRLYGLIKFLRMAKTHSIEGRFSEMEAYANQLERIKSGERIVTEEYKSFIRFNLDLYSRGIIEDSSEAKWIASIK
jgi:hypothetical protein